MQRLRAIESGGGGGGGPRARWSFVWPPIPSGIYRATFNEFVLVNSGVSRINIILPEITEDGDGSRLAIKAGVNAQRAAGEVWAIVQGQDRIERHSSDSGFDGFELGVINPHALEGMAVTQIFTADYETHSWFMAGFWSFGPTL
jgi:hypothetical protein